MISSLYLPLFRLCHPIYLDDLQEEHSRQLLYKSMHKVLEVETNLIDTVVRSEIVKRFQQVKGPSYKSEHEDKTSVRRKRDVLSQRC